MMPAQKPKPPKCTECGSKDLILPGFCKFHWRGGKWTPIKDEHEIADGASIHCQSCGAHLLPDDIRDPPVGLRIDSR